MDKALLMVLGALVGRFVQLVLSRAGVRVRHLRHTRNNRSSHSERRFDFRPEDIDFFEITTWNRGRTLESENLAAIEEVEGAGTQTWIPDDAALRTVRDQAIAASGPGSATCSLVSYRIDTREAGQQQLVLRMRKADYADMVAVREYFARHPQALVPVRDRLRREAIGTVLSEAPPSLMAINVTVMASSGRILAMQRSSSVTAFQLYWQLGPHETMNWSPPDEREPGAAPRGESLRALAERALREEVGLEPDDYFTNVVFSWLGVFLDDATTYVFAHVASRLSEAEIERCARKAESAFETRGSGQAVSWVPFTARAFREIINTWPAPKAGRPDSQGRLWLPHAPISLTNLWRVRGLVGAPLEASRSKAGLALTVRRLERERREAEAARDRLAVALDEARAAIRRVGE